MSSQTVSAKKQQDLQNQYNNFKNSLQQIAQKIGEIEQESEEHKLVLDTLGPLDGDRKCFRLINGVLVEKTVADVIPLLQTNAEGLKNVLEDLVKTYKTKEGELEKWKVSLYSSSQNISHGDTTDANLAIQKKNKIQVVQSA
ncbi:hypothetical protein jhhlp_007341 [Lomentospora prolificans]|uniref:Prefoldin subunit 2 n=1 Tax=Lomentospora prolificans TaxID=41688 RepID=A0A2N3N2E6_9PEZI|nr:hypothetical protein jhhlp_007341 [Lomentospora prolificans]